MSKDVKCPYCDYGQDIDHDDGRGYSEDEIYNQQCFCCEKYFTFTTSISYYYEVEKADCLNGADHKWTSVVHYPRNFPEWKRCETCDEEIRGSFAKESVNE